LPFAKAPFITAKAALAAAISAIIATPQLEL
jgi:hypothetical protein